MPTCSPQEGTARMATNYMFIKDISEATERIPVGLGLRTAQRPNIVFRRETLRRSEAPTRGKLCVHARVCPLGSGPFKALTLLVTLLLVIRTRGDDGLESEYNRVSREEVWPRLYSRVSEAAFVSRPSLLICMMLVVNAYTLFQLGVQVMSCLEAKHAYRSLLLEHNVDIYGRVR
ncbi:unnamed protein product [Schistocephalus solidus]|uniref:Anoctamin n=1 Tax=Schistocephalus solidus TaxID=70667 RepID=A0A183STY8_SCHSO|nr:unnamed protein product [Schistocephalus solidus]